MSSFDRLGRNARLDWLRADSLRRPGDYQRRVRRDKVEAIMDAFDPDGLAVFAVSRREDGIDYVMDGQHRLEAVLGLGMGHRLLLCLVYEGLAIEDEERMFVLINRERLALSRQESFAVRSRREDVVAETIADVLGELGVRLVSSPRTGPYEISALGALEEIDRRAGERGLRMVVGLLAGAWGGCEGGLRGDYLLAVLRTLLDGADPAKLGSALARRTPQDLDAMALRRQKRPGSRGTAAYVLAMTELVAQEAAIRTA
ncbi:MAG: DUF6551 family protein [Chloroflexota bacterium]